ncbi:Ubiquitin-conjugating enzyme E2 [Ceratobasidium theobromae]|uniref:Ubiquitin-conjugating enzyme E2 n=1 Tax=Ceratobasidium theobromae TaxID=1582974 RepID=A0A5N5QQW7_9AGAM|nr:Ubiquitin-conjugating enzyme E2 [Ceratobasidium theobromae]
MVNLRRVQKVGPQRRSELKEIQNNPVQGLSVVTDDDNMLTWNCAIKALDDSPYKKGIFKFKVVLPDDYPFKPPVVTFLTKIYHPGVNEEGQICLPILRDEWKPGVSLSAVLSTISQKINNPSPDDPYEPAIAAQLKDNKSEFLVKAQEWTEQ